MSEKLHRGDVEGLPKQFVSSLKVLFDILDEERSGYVRLVDIEIRWHGEGVNGLPAGVLEALRKVTPPSGLLSFERFVMGLKLAMFKSKHSNADVTSVKDSRRTPTNELTNCDFDSSEKQQQQRDQDAMFRPPHPRDLKANRGGEGSVGVIQLHKIHAAGQINSHQPNKRTYGTAITATVRPNNAINTANGNGVNPGCAGPDSDNRQHRLPHAKLNANANANIYSGHVSGSHPGVDRNERERYSSNGPPPRPLRTHVSAQSHPVNRARSPQENLPVNPAKSTQNLPVNPSKVPPQVPPRDYRKSAKSVIINELKQWQKERLRNGGNPEPSKPPRIISVSSDSRLVDKKSNPNYDIYVNIQELPPSKSDDQLDDLRPTNKVLARRRDPRRHTVANGVDYNMVKWLKLLEEERSLLRQGLECGQRSRDWCQRQMSALQTRQRDFSHPSPSDVAVEESQLRINLLRSRVNEFLHVTKLLMEYSDKSVASQMNLAVKTVPVYDDTITINMLKEQNRMLTKEVGQKGEIITQLEREKASLIREMFEGRALAKGKSGYDDTTFL